jgi:hypothetical protein
VDCARVESPAIVSHLDAKLAFLDREVNVNRSRFPVSHGVVNCFLADAVNGQAGWAADPQRGRLDAPEVTLNSENAAGFRPQGPQALQPDRGSEVRIGSSPRARLRASVMASRINACNSSACLASGRRKAASLFSKALAM